MEKATENEEIEIYHAMLDDEFHRILENDPILDELEKSKHSPQLQYFELMMCMSRVFKIDGVTVSCITPAIWSYLYAIGSPYTTDGKINDIDTDVVLYILHNGLSKIDEELIEKANGFCEANGINRDTAEGDLKTLIYLSFRPLEMLVATGQQQEQQRYDLDWLTHLVSVVSPLTNKTSDDVIYNTSLCECLYYCIQEARKYDYKHEIRRRNSEELNEAIYERTLALGKQYWQEHYAPVDETPKSKD